MNRQHQPHIDFVSALGKLLCSPALQSSFEVNPAMVAELLNVSEQDVPLFTGLPINQVRTQSELLINKRMREVYKFLPLSIALLGKRAKTVFHQYAYQHWPHHYHRHLIDAVEFCNHLKRQNMPLNQSEYNRVNFKLGGKHLALRVAKDANVKGKPYPALQLFYNFGHFHGECRMYLKA